MTLCSAGGELNAISDFFLRAKHWQIFALLFVVPTFAEFSAMVSFPGRMRTWHDLGTSGFIFIGSMLVYVLGFLAWYGSMGIFFSSLAKPELKMDARFFYFSLIYPVIYLPVFFALAFLETGISARVILPLHIVCMICMFYLLYFVARSFGLVEHGRNVSFSEYAGPFFLLWFYPIGIWVIQPRVNKLKSEADGTGEFAAATLD